MAEAQFTIGERVTYYGTEVIIRRKLDERTYEVQYAQRDSFGERAKFIADALELVRAA